MGPSAKEVNDVDVCGLRSPTEGSCVQNPDVDHSTLGWMKPQHALLIEPVEEP